MTQNVDGDGYYCEEEGAEELDLSFLDNDEDTKSTDENVSAK